MSLLVDVQMVPNKILELVKARILANRAKARNNQQVAQLKGPTRPRVQRAKFGADSLTYRRPEPAAVGGNGGFFMLIANTPNPIGFNFLPTTSIPIYDENTFNPRKDKQQTYRLHIGQLPVDYLFQTEIPDELSAIGDAPFDTYDANSEEEHTGPVCFAYLWPGASIAAIKANIPPSWLVIESKITNIQIEEGARYSWVVQSLSNKLNIIEYPNPSGTITPSEMGYRLITGYTYGRRVCVASRRFFDNPVYQSPFVGNFIGINVDTVVFSKRPLLTNQWMLPGPPWPGTFNKFP